MCGVHLKGYQAPLGPGGHSVLSVSHFSKRVVDFFFFLRDTREQWPYCENTSVFNGFVAQEHVIQD